MSSISQAYRYAENVKAGKLLVSRNTRLAVERFERDLSDDRFAFKEKKVNRFLKLCKLIHFTKGMGAGQPVELEDWQVFYFANLFGFYWSESNLRRFNTAYLSVARKNGKSTMSALNGLYVLLLSKASPEVYSAANTRDQAKITYDAGSALIKKSPALMKHLQVTRHEIRNKMNLGIWKPLAAQDKNLDGLNPDLAIVDEIHAAKSDGVYNVLKSGMGARMEPLLSTITTAGFDMGFAYELHQSVEGILNGTLTDESFFGLIYGLDEEDRGEWDNPELWAKANPNLGISVRREYLEQECTQAKNLERQQANFKTKNLNLWIPEGRERWVAPQAWANDERINSDELAGVICYAGLDLGSVSDLTSLVLVFDLDGRFVIRPHFFVPEAAVKKSRGQPVDYRPWVKQGFMTVTPGNTTDYRYVEEKIIDEYRRFNFDCLFYDSWNSSTLILKLTEAGIPMKVVTMGFKSLSPPMKYAEKCILEKRLIHNSNPVMAWNVMNTVPVKDHMENVKPTKTHSDGKIDGVMAMIMAFCGPLDAEIQRKKTAIWIDVV